MCLYRFSQPAARLAQSQSARQSHSKRSSPGGSQALSDHSRWRQPLEAAAQTLPQTGSAWQHSTAIQARVDFCFFLHPVSRKRMFKSIVKANHSRNATRMINYLAGMSETHKVQFDIPSMHACPPHQQVASICVTMHLRTHARHSCGDPCTPEVAPKPSSGSSQLAKPFRLPLQASRFVCMMHPFDTSHAPLRLSCSDWCMCALCRFAGSSVLEEDRASRRLEVDEQGLPRRVSTDIWSPTTSVSPSRAVSTATSRAASRCALIALLHPCPHLHAHLHLRLLSLLVPLSCMQNYRRRWSLDLPVVPQNKSFMVSMHIDSPLGLGGGGFADLAAVLQNKLFNVSKHIDCTLGGC